MCIAISWCPVLSQYFYLYAALLKEEELYVWKCFGDLLTFQSSIDQCFILVVSQQLNLTVLVHFHCSD